jgi:hypothetical protein
MIAAYEARCSAGTGGGVLAGMPVQLILAGRDGANLGVECRIAGAGVVDLRLEAIATVGIYTSISDKEPQKQSTGNHSACSTQCTLSRLVGLSQAGTTYVRAQSRLPMQRWL